jgi:hypothetical protein
MNDFRKLAGRPAAWAALVLLGLAGGFLLGKLSSGDGAHEHDAGGRGACRCSRAGRRGHADVHLLHASAGALTGS